MKQGIFILLLFCISLTTNAQTGEPELQKIFNGKDLSGWQEPQNNIWWTIHDGVLSATSGPEKKGSILWTDKVYKDFIMQFDFRFGKGTVDSGVFIRSDNEQIQLGISGSRKRDMSCSPYIGSLGDYPVEAEGVEDLLKKEDWNAIKIKAKGNAYTVWLNGKQVLNYESDTAIEQGGIGLQLHSNKKMQIDFRNILCAELP